jgi:hypothetical protein
MNMLKKAKKVECSWEGTLKVQKPLWCSESEGGGEYLIYSEDRTIQYNMPIGGEDDKLAQFFPEGQYKAFVSASLRGTILHIGDQVPDPYW